MVHLYLNLFVIKYKNWSNYPDVWSANIGGAVKNAFN